MAALTKQKFNSETIEIGNNIRKFREKMELSQENLAEQLDVSIMTVSRLENGENAMNISTFLKILTVLEVSAADLLPCTYQKNEAQDNCSINLLVTKLISMNKQNQKVVLKTMSALISSLEVSRTDR